MSAAGDVVAPHGVPVIQMRAMGLTYPGSPPVTAVRPTDLSVAAGEYITVVGPSGSGKSSLLNVIGLLDRPSEGTYELDGIDVGGLGEAARTALRGQRIGFVFQAFHLLAHRSATENVAMAQLYTGVPRQRRIGAAREALAQVGLASRLNALPATMSGGERQRVAIARALIHRPSLLLCDEPTGNLDSVTAAEILELLDGLNAKGMTILTITHDPLVASRGQRTIAIRDGALDA